MAASRNGGLEQLWRGPRYGDGGRIPKGPGITARELAPSGTMLVRAAALLGDRIERYMRSRQKYRPERPPMPAYARSFLLCSLLALAGCGEAPKQSAAPPPPTVTVAKPTQRTIVDQDEYVGRFVAVDMVEIRGRVSGYLEQVHFRDGQMVKQGDLLFAIDKRPFQKALAQAKANLALAKF